MKAALLLLALSTAAAADTPKLDLPTSCYEVFWASNEVMRALGFEIQPSAINGEVGATTIYRHIYNTRDWRQVWGKVRRPADTSGGFLPVTTRLRPHDVEITHADYKKHWADTQGRCEVRLHMDFSGWKETLFAEGRERFKSTGELEARILDLIRNQVEAKGLLEGKKDGE